MDGVTFNSEAQPAAATSDIAGNATASWETLELRRTIARTRDEVAGLGLPGPQLETVNRSLDAATQEAAVERPDRYTVGEHLEEVAHRLKEAGALDGVAQALRRATELLGPAGLATVATALQP
jgi:hypothetical protein